MILVTKDNPEKTSIHESLVMNRTDRYKPLVNLDHENKDHSNVVFVYFTTILPVAKYRNSIVKNNAKRHLRICDAGNEKEHVKQEVVGKRAFHSQFYHWRQYQ